MQLSELKTVVSNAGIVGAGGAGFPTEFKLNEGLDTLIINGAECEPLIFTDYYILKNRLSDVLRGADEMINALQLKEGFLAVKKATAKKLNWHHLEQLTDKIRAFALPDVYPVGDEIILIYEVTGRLVEPGKLPFTQGVIVSNAETILNVKKAIEGEGVTEKFVTIGGKTENACMVQVPVGMRVSELLERCNVSVPPDCVLIDGGPAMGKIINTDTAVVTKTTKSLLVLPEDIPAVRARQNTSQARLKRASSVCCQCTLCSELCPRALLGYPVRPHKTVRSVTGSITYDVNDYLTAGLCCGCGICQLISCCQDISVTDVMLEVKSNLGKNKLAYRYHGEPVKPDENRAYRMLPTARFKRRIGVSEFDRFPAKSAVLSANTVILPLSQHAGAPARAVVKAGDTVHKGMLVAQKTDGISANIHASIDGTVVSVDDKQIMIRNDRNA